MNAVNASARSAVVLQSRRISPADSTAPFQRYVL
jgi:hypothetical protein